MNKEDNKGNMDSMEDQVDLGIEQAEPGDSPDTATVGDGETQLEAIARERDQLAAEVEELRDRLLRRQAEFENFRRRANRERAEFAEFAGMEAARLLLPILDDFELSMKAVPEEAQESEYIKGIGIIYQRLMEALGKLGLEPLDSTGKSFDPNVHHAVERVPTDEAEDHTVLEEWRKGYNFKGKLLREAMVRVAVKPSPEDL